MSNSDPRPPVWVGHVTMQTTSVADSNTFMVELGMRPIVQGDGFAVLELRGGTHLVLLPSEDPLSGAAPFDLMVEDLDATHRALCERGLSPSEIGRGEIHDWFTIRDPSGLDVTFNSTHVSDQPV
jgi:catechol 2,3-dioxygenase-like lactoylglutathione lyase family enzyme